MGKAGKIIKVVLQRVIKYFLRGLLLVLPLVGTVLLIYFLLTAADELLVDKIKEVFGIVISKGFGVVITLAVITLIGFVGSGLIFKPLLDLLGELLERIPVVKIIYTTIKDFLEAFVGDKRKFKEPVVVSMGTGLYRMGFVTQKDLSIIDMEGYVTVYFPHSYNISGNVYLVPKENVRPIDINSADVMKFTATGGVTELRSTKETGEGAAETTN